MILPCPSCRVNQPTREFVESARLRSGELSPTSKFSCRAPTKKQAFLPNLIGRAGTPGASGRAGLILALSLGSGVAIRRPLTQHPICPPPVNRGRLIRVRVPTRRGRSRRSGGNRCLWGRSHALCARWCCRLRGLRCRSIREPPSTVGRDIIARHVCRHHRRSINLCNAWSQPNCIGRIRTRRGAIVAAGFGGCRSLGRRYLPQHKHSNRYRTNCQTTFHICLHKSPPPEKTEHLRLEIL